MTDVTNYRIIALIFDASLCARRAAIYTHFYFLIISFDNFTLIDRVIQILLGGDGARFPTFKSEGISRVPEIPTSMPPSSHRTRRLVPYLFFHLPSSRAIFRAVSDYCFRFTISRVPRLLTPLSSGYRTLIETNQLRLISNV